MFISVSLSLSFITSNMNSQFKLNSHSFSCWCYSLHHLLRGLRLPSCLPLFSCQLLGLTGICSLTHFFAPSLNLAIDISSLRFLLTMKRLAHFIPHMTNVTIWKHIHHKIHVSSLIFKNKSMVQFKKSRGRACGPRWTGSSSTRGCSSCSWWTSSLNKGDF